MMNHLKKRTKKIITGTVIGCVAAAVAIIGAVTFMGNDAKEEVQIASVSDKSDAASREENIAEALNDQQVEVPVVEEVEVVEEAPVVEEVPEEVVEEAPVEEVDSEWANVVMADVDMSMNVRTEPSTESEVVGLMRVGDAAEVVERGEEWTKIVSGDVEGYVLNEYCLFGDDAKAYAYENCEMQATVLEDCTRLREEPSTESDIVELLAVDLTLDIDEDAETVENWVAVVYEDETSYLSQDLVEVEPVLTEAITLKAIEEQLIAEQEAAEAERKAQEEAYLAAIGQSTQQTTTTQSTDTSGTTTQSYSAPAATTSAPAATPAPAPATTTTQNAAYSASVDDTTLLAALIYCEAGGEPYEGQVAVGAVVMNRVRSGSFPNTISSVIYQSGQFYPAGSSTLNRAINNGYYNNCMSAAQAALAGTDPTGGLLYFHAGTSGGTLTIGHQTFY